MKITHAQPIAKRVRLAIKSSVRTLKAIERLKSFSQQNHLSGLNWKKLRDERRR